MSDVLRAERPARLDGVTYKVKIELEKTEVCYVTINHDDTGRPVEVFIRLDVPELFEWVSTMTRMISLSLRNGVALEDIANDMEQIFSPVSNHFTKGSHKTIPSRVAHIGEVISYHLKHVTVRTGDNGPAMASIDGNENCIGVINGN